MITRLAAFAAMTFALIAPGLAPAQSASEPSDKNAWHLRTFDGQPDIQGYWSNATITPFERPPALAGKAILSEEEAAQAEAQARNRGGAPPREGDVGTELWLDAGTKVVSTRQTSLVIDPPDGRVPLTSAAEAKRDYNRAHETDSYEYMSVWDRCITRGVPAGMFPAGHNNAYQIIQTPGAVVIVSEMIHNARVIPLDGSPHPPANVQLWDGDSRGHWDGETLVVDTANFNNKGWFATSSLQARLKGVPQTEATHVVERFTRTSRGTLTYQVTVEDPGMFTKPWTVSIPLERDENYRMFEYACHEGNQAVELILRGARAHDKVGEK